MSKTIHATKNEDGTYKVLIKEDYPEKYECVGKEKHKTKLESETVIEKANIYITTYATTKDDKKLKVFTLEGGRV